MWWKSGIILVVFLSVAKAAPTPFALDTSILPGTSIPTYYDVKLTFNVFGSSTLSGVVRIYVQIINNTDTVTLHSRGLTIQSLKVILNSVGLESEYSYEAENDFLHIKVSQELLEGERPYVDITYTALLQTNLLGIYRTSYKADGSTRYLIATQFFEKEARTALPCYDEMKYKSTFKLTLEHESTYSAISNTEASSTTTVGDRRTTIFKITPKMSIYLLAFVVSDYKYSSNEIIREPGQPIHRIYTREESVDSTKFALENSAAFLKELQQYVAYTYELPQMYHASLPDFIYSAMENWGLIVAKEQFLIGDENSHHFDALRIRQVVAHELSHQFFGNLVTSKTRDYLWLTEGFATFFEHLLIENVYPELRSRDFFNIQKLQNAFQIDALESSHPLTHDGETLLREMKYDKPASVIRMFQHAVGEEVFRSALEKYLTDSNHGSVTSTDLYLAFENVIGGASVGFNFTAAFTTWEIQKGFPIIYVTADDSSSNFIINQERYYAASEERLVGDARSWYIPLSYTTAAAPNFNDTNFTNYFPNTDTAHAIGYPTGFNSSNWFIFNKQQIGYYRVNYDTSNWKAIIEVLNSADFTQIHILNRAQLIDDAMNLAADGYLSYQIALGVLSYLSRETDYIPWKAAAANLDKLEYLFKNQPSDGKLKRFIHHLNRRMFAINGMNDKIDELSDQKFSRELSIDLTCSMGDEKCLAQTYENIQKVMTDDQRIPATLEIVNICNGLKGENRTDEFYYLLTRMQNSNDQAERLRIIDGLVCSSDPKLIKVLLAEILPNNTATSYRLHERQRILNNVHLRSSIGLSAMVEFISEVYDTLVDAFSMTTVDSILIAMSKRTMYYEDQFMLTGLLDELEGKLGATTRDDVMKNIEANIEWNSLKYEDAAKFIDDYVENLDKRDDEEIIMRLPTTSHPEHYKLHIDARNIQTGDRAYNGEVEIKVLINEATETIKFHSRNQVIDDLQVFDSDMNEIAYLEHRLLPAADLLTIYFWYELRSSTEITVRIKYSTTMTTYEAGFYQTSYEVDGVKHFLGATQFEGTDARYVFPHYEEPHFKAVFDLSITHNEDYTAIANTLGTSSPNGDGTVTTTFKPTPPMSSYLIAFVVSDLEHISNADSKAPADTLHRIWVRPDSLAKAQFALDSSVAILKTLENYTGFDYEMEKIDSAGVPNKGGAMENWGMVLYRENAMIYAENYDDIPHSQKLSGVNVISHELAHQFFGDAVTCEWWDYIWLNEGFATLFEFHLTGIINPDWNLRHFFNLRKLHGSFRSDISENNKAMTSPTATPQEILDKFDFVVYDKAGSVLRMFQNAVGEEIFTAALKLYLETNNHGAVNSQHLIDAFEATFHSYGFTDFDFERAFRTWELNPGYPLILVTLTETNEFFIQRERFFSRKPPVAANTSIWFMPLNFATPSNADFDDTSISNYFPDGESTFRFTAPSDASQWYIFNKQQLGYYRVNYDLNNWKNLIRVLNSDEFNKIHILNRAQLIDDAMVLAPGGYLNIDYDIFFGILSYLERETEYTPWYAASIFFNQLYSIYGSRNVDVNAFIQNLSLKFYERFRPSIDYTIPIENLYERFGRELAIKLACSAGNADCLNDAYMQTSFHAETEDKLVPKGLENVILCNGFRGSKRPPPYWYAMWNKMLETTDPTFKSQAMTALGCTENSNLLKEYLESSINSSIASFTQGDRRAILESVLGSKLGLEAVFSFLEEWQLDIISKYGYNTGLEPLLTTIAETIKTSEQQTMFINYLATYLHFEPEVLARVTGIVEKNLQTQMEPQYVTIMETIQRILRGEDTTTVETTTAGSSTVESSTVDSSTVESSTVESSTVTPGTSLTTTQSSTTSQSSTSQTTSQTTSQSTSQSPATTQSSSTTSQAPPTSQSTTSSSTSTQTTTQTNPSTSSSASVPTTTTSIPSPSTGPTQQSDTTTQGAAANGIKLLTLIVCFLMASLLKQ